MRRPSSRQRRLVILTLAVLAFGLAYYMGSQYQDRPRNLPAITGVAIEPPAPLPDLPEGEGAPLTRDTLLGHWSLLMLDPHPGETRSPALLRLLRVHNQLAGDAELQQRLTFLYLPRQLAPGAQAAIEGMSDNIHALSGDPSLLAETIRLFGLEADGDRAALYLIGPQARLHALFTPDQDIATIAEDLTTLIIREP